MTETPRLKLPLLQPSQAQKHVTVNEALSLLDGVSQLCLQSLSVTVPPIGASDGDCYGVPSGATDDWLDQAGTIAVAVNGGWQFVAPGTGWRAWVVDDATVVQWKDADWSLVAATQGPSGSEIVFRTLEVDCNLVAGGIQALPISVPEKAMVFAASSRVTAPLTGALTSWELGHASAPNRFGSGMGVSAGSFSHGILGAPLTYYASEALQFSPLGGDVGTGQLRIALHYLSFSLPGA